MATQAISIQGRLPQERESKAEFPIIMFMLALFKDFLIDPIVLILTIPPLTPFGWIFGIMISAIYSGVFCIWMLWNGVGSANQKIKRQVAKRFALILIASMVGFIPFVRFIVPEFTALVLIIHRDNKKNV